MTTYTGHIKEIQESLFLIESLDSQYKIGTMREFKINDAHNSTNIDRHIEYDLDDGKSGVLTIYHRNGAYEIHHHVKSESGKDISGEMKKQADYNAKFVGTMYGFAKRILKTGTPVRIVGNHTNGMFDHYNRLATILAKREGYEIQSPSQYNHPDKELSKDYSEFTISKPTKSPLSEGFVAKLYGRNKSNNYGLTDTQYWLSASPAYKTIDDAVVALFTNNI